MNYYSKEDIVNLAKKHNVGDVSFSFNSSGEFLRGHVNGELFAKQTIDKECRKTGKDFFLCNRFVDLEKHSVDSTIDLQVDNQEKNLAVAIAMYEVDRVQERNERPFANWIDWVEIYSDSKEEFVGFDPLNESDDAFKVLEYFKLSTGFEGNKRIVHCFGAHTTTGYNLKSAILDCAYKMVKAKGN